MRLSLLLVAATAAAARVKTGLDMLIENDYAQLAGKKVIVLTNPTGVTPQLDLGVDVMVESGKIDLAGVMGPEHGFRGTAQAGDAEGTFVDEKTGLTVYDAYLANTTALMSYINDSGADTVLFDIQDVGARFYTCKWPVPVAVTLLNRYRRLGHVRHNGRGSKDECLFRRRGPPEPHRRTQRLRPRPQ